MQAIREKLEKLFTGIQHRRMSDVPVCNPALQVKACGFNEWGDYYLGIIITPWFMNLMLLPQKPSAFDDLQPGEKQTHVFPSGQYEFVTGEEADIGKYLVCSLFSPMFEFEEQKLAEDTAQAILDEIMQVSNYHKLDGLTREEQKRCETLEMQVKPVVTDNNISRRDFLRGRLSRQRG